MTARRVVVTGCGAVTPLGDLAPSLAAIAAGTTALAEPTLLDPAPFASRLGAEVGAFDARAHFRKPKALKLTDRRTRLAVAACATAVADAGICGEALEGAGVLLGTASSDLLAADLARALAPDPGRRSATDVPFFAGRVLDGLNPLWLLQVLPNLASAHVAIQLGARGPNSTAMTDAAAGLQAIGEAASWIAGGECDAAVAGGADTAMHPVAWAGYEQAGLFEPDASGRRFAPGEGSAALVLEARERALARGARPKGELLGFGAVGPAGGETAAALGRAVGEALAGRELPGSAAPVLALDALRPASERAALQAVLRLAAGAAPDAEVLDVTASAGHALAAAGPIAAALLLQGLAPPGAAILVASLGLSGQAAALLLVRAGEEPTITRPDPGLPPGPRRS